MRVKFLLGLVGVIFLAIGFFLPVITDKSYEFGPSTLAFYKAVTGGIIIIFSLLVLSSLMLILIRKFGGLWLTGVALLLVLLLSLVSWGIDWILGKQMETEILVSFHWGWGVLFVGTFLIIAAAAIPNKRPDNLKA